MNKVGSGNRNQKTENKRAQWIKFAIVTLLYLLFLY